jgi:tRNA-dihydrouridine synthase A
MMDHTDRHFRVLLRQLTRRTLLYTEMITTGAILNGDRDWVLGFDPAERPLALQLGGDDPEALALCARIAQERGFDEVNLNVGCPSDRVLAGRFGACLMARPERVAEVVAAMRSACALPVTVKHRLGIDDQDRYQDVRRFVSTVANAGCDRFTVHARKAWLSGLSPKQNREVPPLRHEDVHRLKADLPHLAIELNGGLRDLRSAREHLAHVDAVMIGRFAYDDPWAFREADPLFFGEPGPAPATRHDVVRGLLPHVRSWVARGGRLADVTRHLLGVFAGRRGARAWRRHLSVEGCRSGAGAPVVEAALALVPEDDPA